MKQRSARTTPKQLIIDHMRRLGMNQSDLVRASGVGRSTLSRFLDKHSTDNPRIETLDAFARGLGYAGFVELSRDVLPAPPRCTCRKPQFTTVCVNCGRVQGN